MYAFLFTVLRICNDGKVPDTTTVFIDTARDQPLNENPCHCTISSNHKDIHVIIEYVDSSNGSNAKNFQFAINNKTTRLTTLKYETKLVFPTRLSFVKGGVCLKIAKGWFVCCFLFSVFYQNSLHTVFV
jgi:hypothetical protein